MLAFVLAAILSAVHPFGVDDYVAMRSASAVAVAPDGRTVLYRLAYGKPKGNGVTEWWTTSTDGTGARKLTLPKGFTPYGFTRSATELYGHAKAHEQDQLALVTIGTRRPRILTAIPSGISGAVLSPDGRRFAVIGDPTPVDPLAKVHTVVANALASIYVVDANGANGRWWCRNLSGVGGLAWSADATRLAVVSQTPRIGYSYVKGRIDVCSASGDRHLATIDNATMNEIPYPGAGVAWANGERDIAFLSTTTHVLTPDHVWTVPVAGGPPVDRTPDLHATAEALRGTPHGEVWVSVANGVQTEIRKLTPGGLDPMFVRPDAVAGLPLTTELAHAPRTIVSSVADPSHPNDVAVAHGTTLVRITHADDDNLAHVALGRVIRHRWTAADGTPLEAIVTFPAGYNGRATKFVVLPHGGPEANDTLHLDAFSRIIAGRGYVVMQPQYRGSTGYGTPFLEAIYQKFGDTAYHDVDAATTEAVARGWADPQRLAIFGWSAGGFMTAWTVTQTNRYRAAIEGAGITDWLSFINTSDVQQIDYNQDPITDPEPFLRYSAVMHAENVTTPLLILHGEADERVPTYQGREYFNVLREHGKTVKFVTYPGSPHFPRLWEQRRDVFAELLGWLKRYDP